MESLGTNNEKAAVSLDTYFDWPMHIWTLDAQHNLPSNGDPIEEVVDEAHVVDERVNVTGAEHEECGDALGNRDSGVHTFG